MISSYNQLTPQMMELVRLGVIIWNGDSSFRYKEEHKHLVELSMRPQKDQKDWTKIIKDFRVERDKTLKAVRDEEKRKYHHGVA